MSSILSNSSTASLISNKPRKDFSAAFGSLQSQFGFGASAPIISAAPSKKAKAKPTRVALPAVERSAPADKDWALAFSNLQSQYGYGGSAPFQATVSGQPST